MYVSVHVLYPRFRGPYGEYMPGDMMVVTIGGRGNVRLYI